MIKIFTSNKVIYLTNKKKKFTNEEKNAFFSVDTKEVMPIIYDKTINVIPNKEVYFYNKNKKKLFTYFSSMFRVIEAAGGLVKNDKGEYLFIFRNGKWDLPKGKIEKKETIKNAAIREVKEECGIGKLKISKKLIQTYHIYSMEEKSIIKRTYWFEMLSNDEEILIPQTEEGITDVKWIAKSNFRKVLGNTYPSIVEVLKEIKN